ncbi:BgTH12-00993 [Blumeria graminis f. sp. triticale]|uniref:BgTH12-00993 n=1 Tax=Blumeria graminis f. sp. triticale TaxID=1689686 RepID=A0A9W4DBQ2_BLUGR|nr:BgTH12-00993 [Blumeria graminis f. sp. triticale]
MPSLNKRLDRACENLAAQWYSCSANDDYERSTAFQGCCSVDPCHLLACPDQESMVTKSNPSSIATPTIRMETSSTISSTTALVNMLSATTSAALSLTSSGGDSSYQPTPITASAIEESGIKFPTTKSDIIIAIAAATASGLLIVAICLCLVMRHGWGLHDWRCDVSRDSMREKNRVPGMTLLNHHDSSLEDFGGRCNDFSNFNGYRNSSSSRGVSHAGHSHSISAMNDNDHDNAPLPDFEKNQLVEPPIDAHPAYRNSCGWSTVSLQPSRLISCEFSSPHQLNTMYSPRITPIPSHLFSETRHLVTTDSYDKLLQKCHSLPPSYNVPLNSHKYGTLASNQG